MKSEEKKTPIPIAESEFKMGTPVYRKFQLRGRTFDEVLQIMSSGPSSVLGMSGDKWVVVNLHGPPGVDSHVNPYCDELYKTPQDAVKASLDELRQESRELQELIGDLEESLGMQRSGPVTMVDF